MADRPSFFAVAYEIGNKILNSRLHLVEADSAN